MNAFIYNYDISELQEVQAMGSGLINFYSSQSGNNFENIELPDTIYTIWMNNSNWNNLSFWHTNIVEGNQATFSQLYSQSKSSGTVDGSVPTNVHNISLLGTTGSTTSSILFVRNWLNSLITNNADLSQYTLVMDKINWSDTTVGANNLLTYEELGYIAQLSNQSSLRGYLVLKDTGEELSSQ